MNSMETAPPRSPDIRTKIVVTLGPASSDAAVIRTLIQAGMNVARLNFSHGTHEEHAERLRLVRQEALRAGRHIAVLQDLQGPRLRIGSVAPGTTLTSGNTIVLDADENSGSASRAGISFAPEVARSLEAGDRILIDDGALELVTTGVGDATIEAQVVVGGALASRKGVNLPDARVDLPPLTQKDIEDLRFGLELGVDFVALSFVGSAEDLRRLRRILRDQGGDVPIVAKIERQGAVNRIDEIIAEADFVMVARGDLALEIGAAAVPLVQKDIIRQANAATVPVITATQMLDSMIRNPAPTRAETSDVANAILDGTDAVMLSGETAIGQYPIEAVLEMRGIARATEVALSNERIGRRGGERARGKTTQAICESAVELARRLDVSAIVAATTTGYTARAVAKNRPEMLLIGATQEAAVCRRMAAVWGVTPLLVGPYGDTDEMVRVVGETVEDLGLLDEGDAFIIISGQPVGRPGSTNMIQVRHVGDWRDALPERWPLPDHEV